MKKEHRFLAKDVAPLKALMLLGTLKHAPELSHTETLAELLAESLEEYNVTSEILRLVDFHILPGIKSDMGEGDDWPKILKKVMGCDILIFGTPIWWGVASSEMQRVFERMDELNEEILKNGSSDLSNKVGGIIITGGDDGAQHVIGNMADFMIWNGLTLPPACSLSYLGPFPEKTKKELLEKFRQRKSTLSMAKIMAKNLVFYARLLKENPLPQEKGAVSQDIT